MRYSATDKAAAARGAASARQDDVLQEDWFLLGSTYALIVASTLLLAVAENTLSYCVVCVTLCIGHAMAVGPGGKPLLSAWAGQFLAVGALLFGLLQTRSADLHLSYGLAHFLVAIQLIKLYGPHRARDLRLIQVTVIFQAMVAGVWALDLLYLPAFLLLTISLIANMGAISLASPMAPLAPRRGPALIGHTRAVGWAAGLWMPAAIVGACTVVLFVMLPRVRASTRSYWVLPEQVTGYSENVSLHEVGQLRESEEIVMRVRFTAEDRPGQPYVRPPQVLMRGGARPLYHNGQWFGYGMALRNDTRGGQLTSMSSPWGLDTPEVYLLEGLQVDTRRIRQVIIPESRPMKPLFGLHRWIRAPGMEPYESATITGLGREIPGGPYRPGETHEVVSIVPLFTPPQLRAAGTPRDGLLPSHWRLPASIEPILTAVAAEIKETYRPQTDYDRIAAAQRYLLDPDRFAYTYDLPEFGTKEPIEAFLTETKRGSCEQFSTALALIVRAWDIPSRLVVGFKGGDFDPQTKMHVFRDKHAHAWTEIYFNGLGWVQFDPTPGANVMAGPREGILGKLEGWVEGGRGSLMRLYGRVNARWGGDVVGYSRTQQQRMMESLAEAARSLAGQAGGIVGALWPAVPSLGLVQVGLLVAGVTLVGMSLHMLAHWLQDRMGIARRRAGSDGPVRFYQNLLRILRRKGIVRAPHVSPREFAAAASRRLSGPSEDAGAPQQAIALVTDLYCRVRYGRHDLTAEERNSLRRALRQVAQAGARAPGAREA